MKPILVAGVTIVCMLTWVYVPESVVYISHYEGDKPLCMAILELVEVSEENNNWLMQAIRQY